MKSFFSSETLFARIMNKIGEMILLSILWIVFSLPIITIGASTTAAYYTAAKVLRHDTGYEFRMFLKSFRLNFKQTIGINLIFVVIVAFLIFNFIFTHGEIEEIDFYLRMIYIGISLFILGYYIYLYPVLSRFTLGTGKLLIMGMQMMFRHFPTTLALVSLCILTIVGIYFMPWAALVFPGVYMYVKTFLMERVMRKYMPKPEEGSEEEENWYYN